MRDGPYPSNVGFWQRIAGERGLTEEEITQVLDEWANEVDELDTEARGLREEWNRVEVERERLEDLLKQEKMR